MNPDVNHTQEPAKRGQVSEAVIGVDSVGYRLILKICLPLMMSTAAVTVMEFSDRAFLAHYSLEAISAATPAGIVALLFIVFFSGVVGYAGVFIAQYTGAGAHARVGAALWQALYFSILSGGLMIGLAFFGEPIFQLGGHAPAVRRLEVIYFRILCLGAFVHIANAGLSAFYTGRGETRPVLLCNTVGMVINIPLDYALIFGAWGFPELGIAGAGLATVASWGSILLLYLIMIFNRRNERRFAVLRNWRPDRHLFSRLMRYGIPGGLQVSLDIVAFLFFIFLVGRLGTMELAASNIVIAINSLAFMPALGFSQGIATLVGQALGANQPSKAKDAVRKAIHLLLVYTFLIDLAYLLAPEPIIAFFIPAHTSPMDHVQLKEMCSGLLRIVAVYVFMDALYMSYVGALRGAGDTRFTMWSMAFASVLVMIVPSYVVIEKLRLGIYVAWICVLAFVASLFMICWLRYRQGRWQSMRVVEKEVIVQTAF